MIAQYCACPIPLAHLLRMMDCPPDFEPPKEHTRPHKLSMSLEYLPREESAANKSDRAARTEAARLRLLSALSKTRWTSAEQIARVAHVLPGVAAKAMQRGYMLPLVDMERRKIKSRMCGVWRLKP